MLLMECLAALGVAVLLWTFLGWLLRPRPAKNLFLVVRAQDGGEGLEQTVRAAGFLRKTGWLPGETLIINDGLDQAGLAIAALLEDEYTVLCEPKELAGHLGLRMVEHGGGTPIRHDPIGGIPEP